MTSFKEFLKEKQELLETPIPDSWDDKIFTKNVSFADQLKYALDRSKKIGEGSSRVAFEIEYKGRPTILKIAKNEKGLEQNSEEANILSKTSGIDIVIPLIDYDQRNSKPKWIHTEKADAIKEGKLCRLIGTPNLLTLVKASIANYNKKDIYVEMLEEYNADDEDQLEVARYYIKQLSYLETEYGIHLGDFKRIQNWGLYKNKPVVIDVGFTEYVKDNYYKKS